MPTLPYDLAVQATDVAMVMCRRLGSNEGGRRTESFNQSKGELAMNLFDRVMANIVMVAFTIPLVMVAIRMLLAYLKGVSV